MENGGRLAVPMAILVGILLSILLLFLSTNISNSPSVQSAQANSTVVFDDGHDHKEAGTASTDQSTEVGGGSCQVSDKFPESILQWCELITSYANLRGFDPDLLAALILQESGGELLAYSHSGAVGLMQVMPRDGLAASFMCMAGPCFQNRPTRAELEIPKFNIEYGSELLANLVQKHGSLREALKSYGPVDVGYAYSDRVLALYRRYRN